GVRAEGQPRGEPVTTQAATSAISLVGSWLLNDGIAPLPWRRRSIARPRVGFDVSRSGPTVPVAPASLSVWQAVQPSVLKIVLPATGSPFAYSGGTVSVVCPGTVPTTVWATGATTLPPQPLVKRTIRTASRPRRRTGATVPFEP